MWAKIFGWLSVLLGVLWVLWPGLLKGWFIRRAGREALWLALVLLIVLFVQCGALIHRLPAGWPRSAATSIAAAAAVVFWVSQSRMRASLKRRCESAPLEAFRLFGWIQLAAGLGLLLGK